MIIDKYKQEDGYYDPEGLFWETAESFLQGYVLGFCCCGIPRENLELVRDALQHIDTEHAMTWKGVLQHQKEIFGSERLANFVYYWLADKEFTDHGGMVPGWLTDKGKELLADLNEFLAMPVEE